MGRGFPALFALWGNKEAREVSPHRACLKIYSFAGLRSERLHGRSQADIRAAGGTLSSHHHQSSVSCCAAAIFLRAVKANAFLARNADFLGDRLVARNLFFDSFCHAAFGVEAALGIGADFFVNRVVTVCNLLGFSAVTCGLRADAKHRAARRETQGKGDENKEAEEFFHRCVFWIF
jgi:hypothetical protein